jgi:hypothetical protein
LCLYFKSHLSSHNFIKLKRIFMCIKRTSLKNNWKLLYLNVKYHYYAYIYVIVRTNLDHNIFQFCSSDTNQLLILTIPYYSSDLTFLKAKFNFNLISIIAVILKQV